MGRPLNKKYFGNRNIGSASTTADNKIGGKRISSINWSSLGSFNGNGTFGIDGLALPEPALPGGVQATWALVYEVSSVSTGAGNTNLAIGDTFADNASFPGMIAKVTSLDNGSGNAVFSVLPADGASRGSELGYPELLADTIGVTLTQTGGTGTAGSFLVDVLYRVKSAAINEQGSGYLGTETFTATITGNGNTMNPPAGTIVFAADTGAVGSATNQENAIVIHARLDIEGSVLNGDIIKQVASRRYKVKTNSGTAVCKLVDSDSPGLTEAYIKATDANGNTYFVTKLTAHRVRLTQWTNNEATWLFANGATAPWTFDSTANGHVIVENA